MEWWGLFLVKETIQVGGACESYSRFHGALGRDIGRKGISMRRTDEKVIAIARRTRHNLDFMDERHRMGEKVYEFTHLFNSMLGMIICVREEYYKSPPGLSDPSVEWSDLNSSRLSFSNSIQKKARSFSKLLTNLRHAFAHSNFEFTVDSNDEISGIEVWNERNGEETWRQNFPELELREIADLALSFLELSFGLEFHGDPK